MKNNIVEAEYFSGFNISIFQLFGLGPKFTIVCGKCLYTFRQRVPVMDNPTVLCPHCGIINVLPLEVE